MNIALNVFEAAVSKKRWKKPASGKGRKSTKPSWERENPEAARLLRWAMKDVETSDEILGQVQLPQRLR